MNNNLLKIRKANSNDAKNWCEFSAKMWRYAYKDIFPEEVFVDKENKIEEKIKKFNEEKQNNNNSISYVAEYDGKIIGIMHGSIKSSYKPFCSDYADLRGIYIDPKFQGCGIGTSLKNIFEAWAIENGASKYVIGVLKDNKKARKVYESWGGKLSSYEESYVKLGIGYPEVFYTYNL